jgi:16S rRNA (uracil1498-N3)-methyltransferase
MIEKLSELGVARYVPLRTARSVVHPEGRGKLERWERIAVEAAKQCRRPGVMRIDPLTPLAALMPTLDATMSYFFSTRPASKPFVTLFGGRREATLLIGPEGDWTADEEDALAARGLTAAGLGRTILRVETAAVLAAGLATQIAAAAEIEP